jgi:hypothetical protein
MIASHMDHSNYPLVKHITSVFVPRFFGLKRNAVWYAGALPPSYVLHTQAARSSKTLKTNQTTRCHKLEDLGVNFHRLENIKYYNNDVLHC